ncbi:GMC oxidoreductase [Rhodofomes roseus]|uniref:GMC oxidoreductase n=1 Tax=Rhodofomes roseus TaxID=34475 RepID=A0ABQ8KX22_9APHY|nr:GMC oxidoreductase [Rhodofomes roseus]KAH9843598.1 GMC oxidoreductase [Rhodofomes roseus]
MQNRLATIGDVAGKHFDFVVIGGGTAGLTLASRLTENPRVSVVVLEAGDAHFEDSKILTPDGFMRQLRQPEYDWAFWTVPQKHSGDKVISWSRGKGLGGSSAMNFLMWTTPQREDIDGFEKLGNTGWKWEMLATYMKKIERSPSGLGLIPVGYAHTPSGAELPFQQSMNANGIPIASVDDTTCGSWMSPSSIEPETGCRVDATTAYLLPALQRPNLHVLTGAYVTKLLTSDGTRLTAMGAEFVYNSLLHNVYVDKEIILSAGAVKSPQILELSGIGNCKLLRSLGIPVKMDLPAVGGSLRDKVTVSIVLEMKEGHDIFSFNLMANPEFHSRLNEVYPNATGKFSSVVSGMTFIPTQALPEGTQASIFSTAETFVQNAKQHGLYTKVHELLMDHLGNSKVPDFEVIVTPFVPGAPNPKKAYIALVICLSHPFSSGDTHIQSADPQIAPLIDPCVFECAIDLNILVEAFKFTRKVIQTAPFCDLVSKEIRPGPEVQSDNEIKAAIQGNIATIWHSSGTVSMMPKEIGGVVDTKLKVYGTTNVRVVDMSIVPLPIGTHTQCMLISISHWYEL